jgi:hypothetical protein
VVVYGVCGRRGIIFIPEGCDGKGWRSFVLELGKISDYLKVPIGLGLVRPAPVREKTRRDSDGAHGGFDLVGYARPFSKDGAPSFVEFLRSGSSGLEVERKLFRPVVPLVKDIGDRLEELKLPIGSENVNSLVNPLGKGHCDRCGSENVKAVKVSAARDKTGCFFGDISTGYQLTGEMNTYSSLLIWKSQLEKLKADVDQAFSRVCEGLLVIGPGFKPNVNRRKRKNKHKKKRRLRWVQKDSKPNACAQKDSVVLPVESLSPAKGFGGLDKYPATSEISGGLGFSSSGTLAPRNQFAVCSSSFERGSRPDFA